MWLVVSHERGSQQRSHRRSWPTAVPTPTPGLACNGRLAMSRFTISFRSCGWSRWDVRVASRSAVLAAVAIAELLTASSTTAQLPAATDGITLQTALETALSQSAQVQLGERQVQMELGALLVARAPFDAQLTTSLATARENSVTPGASGGFASALTRTMTYSFGLPKRLRSGFVLTPRVGLTRVDVENVPGALTSRATVDLGILVPLLRDRGGAVARASERAAEHGYEASILEARHTTAASILGVAVAYWNELAAEERLGVYRSSEERAEQLVDDTRKLVAAGERPAADLDQLLANLALKRAARATGEQSGIEARQQLALAMSVYGGSTSALPRAVTAFPEILPDGAGLASPSHDAIAAALGRRADLAALVARRAAAEAQLAGVRGGLRPRFDLTVGFGYVGFAADDGVDGAFSSFYRHVPGLNASVQLSYELPLSGLAANGAALQSASASEQARIRQAELVRQISSGVLVASEALRHSRVALQASREAAALSHQAVENEKRKFQLGMSTLFDVILAEDALTNARLGEIAGQHDYAVAVVRLRYECGSLLAFDGKRVTVNAASVTTPP